MKSVYTIIIADGMVAKLVLRQGDQRHTSLGDEVCIDATLILPSVDKPYLAHGLRFDTRVSPVFGHRLNDTWNDPEDFEETGVCARYTSFYGKTWDEAQRTAMEFTEEELKPLIDALAIRAASARSAGPFKLIHSAPFDSYSCRIYDDDEKIED